MTTGAAPVATRAGLAVTIFLILLIGGRIVPSFTRNWLDKRGEGPMPAPFGRFDGVALARAALALGAWIAAPESPAARAMLAVAALLHVGRLARWCGLRCLASPLLARLHVAYAFVPAGFAVLVAAALVRSFAPHATLAGVTGLTFAGAAWSLAFAIFVARVGPWLVRARTGKRLANPAPRAPA